MNQKDWQNFFYELGRKKPEDMDLKSHFVFLGGEISVDYIRQNSWEVLQQIKGLKDCFEEKLGDFSQELSANRAWEIMQYRDRLELLVRAALSLREIIPAIVDFYKSLEENLTVWDQKFFTQNNFCLYTFAKITRQIQTLKNQAPHLQHLDAIIATCRCEEILYQSLVAKEPWALKEVQQASQGHHSHYQMMVTKVWTKFLQEKKATPLQGILRVAVAAAILIIAVFGREHFQQSPVEEQLIYANSQARIWSKENHLRLQLTEVTSLLERGYNLRQISFRGVEAATYKIGDEWKKLQGQDLTLSAVQILQDSFQLFSSKQDIFIRLDNEKFRIDSPLPLRWKGLSFQTQEGTVQIGKNITSVSNIQVASIRCNRVEIKLQANREILLFPGIEMPSIFVAHKENNYQFRYQKTN